MKRIFFISPNLNSANSIIAELKSLDVPTKNIHALAKNHDQLDKTHLQLATLLQTTDILHPLIRGAVAGTVVGLIIGLIAVKFYPGTTQLGNGTVVALTLFGLGFGAWISTMVGISIPDPIVEKYSSEIEQGKILIMIDAPRGSEHMIKSKIHLHHPEALIEGYDLEENPRITT